MKSFKILVVLLIPFLLSGCFEMNEEIQVNANGSGSFAMKMDMGKLIDMMQAFMPADELEKASHEAKDTTVQMKDIIDTASTIPPERKAVLRNGSLHMQMNLKEKIFKMDIQYPFSSLDNLQKLYDNLGQDGNGIAGLLKSLNGNAAPPNTTEPDLKQLSSYFDLVVRKGSLVRKLNREKYARLATDSMMQQMKQMGSMGGGMGEVSMNTTIKLPGAAKKVTGSRAQLSDDKKGVTLKNNLLDIFDHPEVFEFSVEY